MSFFRPVFFLLATIGLVLVTLGLLLPLPDRQGTQAPHALAASTTTPIGKALH